MFLPATFINPLVVMHFLDKSKKKKGEHGNDDK